MKEFAYSFHHFMQMVSIAGLVAIAVSLCAYFIARLVWDPITRKISKLTVSKLVAAVCVLGWIQYGSTKSSFRYDGGIKQGVAESYTTNDTVFISWQRDTSQGVYVPDSAAVYIDYRPNTETNAEWGLLAESTVAAGSWTGNLADATNYDFNVWAYYIPPEPVHTNGVWIYKTLKDRGNKCALPLRARVEVNGLAISTPLAKRRDLPYDAEVEYLETKGSQWIETGIPASLDTVFETRVLTPIVNDNYFCSLRISGGGNDRYYLMNFNTSAGYAATKSTWPGSHVVPVNFTTIPHEISSSIKLESASITVDGVTMTFPDTTSVISSKTLPLFGAKLNNSDVANAYSPVGTRCYYARFVSNGNLARDMIPVRFTNELGETEGAMYDRVSGQLFRNQGSGAFLIGPDTRRIK